MTDTLVPDIIPFVQYEAAAAATTFDYGWWIREATDLQVFVDGDLVATDDYSVTGVQSSTGGQVILATPLVGGEIVTVTTKFPFGRLTAFQTSGSLRATALNLELSYLAACVLQLQRDLNRTMKLSPSSQADPTLMVWPEPEDGRIPYWNGSEGVMSNSAFSIDVLQGNAADIAANITAINALYTQLAAIVNVSENLGPGLAVTVVAQNLANILIAAAATANIDIVAINAANVSAVAANIANVNTTAGISADVTAVAGISSDVTTVAAIDMDVSTVSGISANVTTVATNMTSVVNAANNIPKANLSATTDPSVGDDAADGYQAGSLWVNVTLDKVFVCADATNGAAVWNNVSGGVTDGDKGDVVVSSSGTVWTLDTVTVAKGGTGATDAATAFSNLKQAATTSATGVVELATTAETTARTDTSRAVTPEGLQGIIGGGTNVSLSGTSTVLSTSIPSWAKKVTVILNNVSLSGTSVPKIQLGTSVSYVNSGYTSYACAAAPVNPYAFVTSSTTGFALTAGNATIAQFVKCEFTLLTGNTWVWSACGGTNNGSLTFGISAGGSVSLGGTLTRAQILTDNGTDTIDSGSATLFWE